MVARANSRVRSVDPSFMRITRIGPAYLDAAVSMASRVSTITSSSL